MLYRYTFTGKGIDKDIIGTNEISDVESSKLSDCSKTATAIQNKRSDINFENPMPLIT